MANGSFAGGVGSTANPYLVEDAKDLDAVRNNLSASYKLIKDIDLGVSPYNVDPGWIPIGDSGSPFEMFFNGDGHIISNLFINASNKANIGLFGCTSGGIINNIKIVNVNIIGNGVYVGGLVGRTLDGSCISNCCSSGNIIGYSTVGGLIGRHDSGSIIRNCYSNCNVNGNSDSIGGLIGSSQNNAKVINCYSTGLITGAKSPVGGLLGYNNGGLTNSYWDKETSGQSVSGGGIGLTTIQMKDPSNFTDWGTQMLDDGVTPVWILKEGEYPKLWFEAPLTKFLIKDKNNILYTFDGVNIMETVSQVLNSDNFINNGFNDSTIITESTWNNNFPDKTGLQLLMYTNDATVENLNIEYNVNDYTPADILKEINPKIQLLKNKV